MSELKRSPRKMRRLSSSITVGYKVIFPAVWLAAFGSTVLFFWGATVMKLVRGENLPRELIALAVAFSVGLIAGLIVFSLFCFPLRHVSLKGDALCIEGIKKKIEVPLADIAEVRGWRWSNPEVITLVLKRDTVFGQKIKFTPSYRMLRVGDHPSLTDLEVRVTEANQSSQPTPVNRRG